MNEQPQPTRDAIKKAHADIAAGVPTDAPVEKGGYKTSDGTYTEEHQAIQNQVIDKLMPKDVILRATPPPGVKPKYVILGGRGGSGKSFFTNPGGPVDKNNFLVINNDDIKEALPEYKGWNAALVHEEASEIMKRMDLIARNAGLNVIHDSTMKSPKTAETYIKAYRDAGYDVEGHYMFLPRQEAARRAIGRFMHGSDKAGPGATGRFVPPEYVLDSTTNEKTFDAMKPQFDKWSIYSNEVPKGQAPDFIASGGK